MRLVKIRKGEHKGKRGFIIKEEGDEATVQLEGEEKPVKVKIDWVKVLNVILSILEIVKIAFSNKNLKR